MKVLFCFRAKNKIIPTVSDDALPEQKIPAKPEQFEYPKSKPDENNK